MSFKEEWPLRIDPSQYSGKQKYPMLESDILPIQPAFVSDPSLIEKWS